jgi:excinuclease ABC subunit C
VRVAPAEFELLERTLGRAFFVPETEADGKLLSMAETNAEYALKAMKRGEGHGLRALEDVAERLHLEEVPHRIECYDISNLQGGDAVGSRVTFIDGEPVKDFYRRYKIKTVEGANDFAMMKEVLGRRFARRDDDDAWPDLVLLDGGKGQLAQGVRVFAELGVQGVALASLAKARTESDFTKAEVKGSSERVFLPNRKNPVVLAPHTRAFKLLTHLRDEAHRFAITYHRKVRAKRTNPGL